MWKRLLDSIITIDCHAPTGPIGNDVYLLADPSEHVAWVVDPAPESAGLIADALQARGLQLDRIVLTHAHWDHVADASQVASDTGARIAAHSLDAARLAQPQRSAVMPGVEIGPIRVTEPLADGDALRLGGVAFTVLHTPGHTPGSICLHDGSDKVLLSGDTLFAAGMGRVDLPGGDERQMVASLRRLAALPAETRVLPGHGPTTTIGAEQRWLPQAEG